VRSATIETVLLVEDNSDFRELLTSALATWGYNVLAVEDGRRGLAIINDQAEKIDMLLLDITLPFVSGLKPARVLRSVNVRQQSA
jgi:DNA-binding response OmpR family regulator